MKVLFPLTEAAIPGSLIIKDIGEIVTMQKWLLGAVAAAFVLGVSVSGLMAAPGGVGKPSDPPQNAPPNRPEEEKPNLDDVSLWHANMKAVLRTAEKSPVFAASPVKK